MYQTYSPAPGRVRFDWIGESWQLFLAQWSTWALTILVAGVIYIAISVVAALPFGVLDGIRSAMAHPGASSSAYSSTSAVDLLGQLFSNAVNLVVTAYFYCGLFRMANKQVRGEVIAIGDVFNSGSAFLPMLGFMVVFSILALAGTCCLFVGLVVVYALFFPGFALIAEGVSFGDAFSRAFDGMKRDWFSACLFVIVFGLVQLFGTLLTCGIGLFALYPMKFLATSLAVRDMIGPVALPNTGGYYPTQGPATAWPPPPNISDPPPATGAGQYGPPQSAGQWPSYAPPAAQSPPDQPPPAEPPGPTSQT